MLWACRWILSAWNEIQSSTIDHCWCKSTLLDLYQEAQHKSADYQNSTTLIAHNIQQLRMQLQQTYRIQALMNINNFIHSIEKATEEWKKDNKHILQHFLIDLKSDFIFLLNTFIYCSQINQISGLNSEAGEQDITSHRPSGDHHCWQCNNLSTAHISDGMKPIVRGFLATLKRRLAVVVRYVYSYWRQSHPTKAPADWRHTFDLGRLWTSLWNAQTKMPDMTSSLRLVSGLLNIFLLWEKSSLKQWD